MSPVQTVTYVFGLDTQRSGAADRTRTYDPIITNFAVLLLDLTGPGQPKSHNSLRINCYLETRSWAVLDRASEHLTYIPY